MEVNNKEYQYNLAYQNIALEIYFVFRNNKDIGLAFLHKITLFFFKDYLLDHNNKYFPYIFLIEAIDFLIKILDKDAHDDLKRILKNPEPFWTSSWISSWFSNEAKEINIGLRIMDYLIVSHPLAILYLCAQVK